jgi:predicted branched-subunit amino acid permease
MTERDRRFALAGARAAIALPAWIIGFAFVGVGSLARDVGHPLGAALLSTILIYAGPAQLILYTSLADGGLVLGAAIAVAFSAIRLFPMTMSILPYLRRPNQSLAEQLLLAHPVAATIWMESMRHLPGMEPAGRVPYYAGFAGTCMVICVTFTGLGYALVGELPRPLAVGLICVTPIYFTIAMASGARLVGDWLAIVFGLGFLPLAQAVIGTDFDILAAGLVGGTCAYLVGRAARRRHEPGDA